MYLVLLCYPEYSVCYIGDDNCTLFVKNLPSDVTENSLKKLFNGAKTVRLPTNSDGSAKGFAFVEFGSEAEVTSAMENEEGYELSGQSLVVDFSGNKSRGGKSARGGQQSGGRGGRGGERAEGGTVFALTGFFSVSCKALC